MFSGHELEPPQPHFPIHPAIGLSCSAWYSPTTFIPPVVFHLLLRSLLRYVSVIPEVLSWQGHLPHEKEALVW